MRYSGEKELHSQERRHVRGEETREKGGEEDWNGFISPPAVGGEKRDPGGPAALPEGFVHLQSLVVHIWS